jgi:hypothetical protein
MRREEETRQKVIAALIRQATVQAEEAAERAEAVRLAALPQGTAGFGTSTGAIPSTASQAAPDDSGSRA